jgi:hypothetical protein
MKIAIAQTIDPTARTRRSSDSVWPLRRADGRTYAEVQPHYQPKAGSMASACARYIEIVDAMRAAQAQVETER